MLDDKDSDAPLQTAPMPAEKPAKRVMRVVLAIVGSVLVIVGVFLPWFRSAPGISVEPFGLLSLTLASASLILVALRRTKWLAWVGLSIAISGPVPVVLLALWARLTCGFSRCVGPPGIGLVLTMVGAWLVVLAVGPRGLDFKVSNDRPHRNGFGDVHPDSPGLLSPRRSIGPIGTHARGLFRGDLPMSPRLGHTERRSVFLVSPRRMSRNRSL